jgi:hydrogenase maturation protein HypF
MKRQCIHLIIYGAVQGVGFRPFIYRLATELGLTGWVNNSAQGVLVEVEGTRELLETFLARLPLEKPPRSQIQTLAVEWLEAVGYSQFEIRRSIGGAKTAIVLPDIATCPDCLQEIFDPGNRRYRYPFTNCTNCGPRYSIIEKLPYDRCNTTMQGFVMCPDCQTEYDNPRDRRFHAQPNACPHCGPHLEFWGNQGAILATENEALLAAANAIREGKIVAIKGLGGFHLMADASNPEVINKLRQRKCRPDRALALMYPSLDLIKIHCEVTPLEAQLLLSPESPIVLLRQKSLSTFFNSPIAPGNLYLGVMLPHTPLHHLLLSELGFPVVATSGNLSDEPICIDEQEALLRLGKIADNFLVHNRPIARPIDDSVVCLMGGREMLLRRARGYAPLPIAVKVFQWSKSKIKIPPILAVGGHLKNTIAILNQGQVFVSQHIGDLTTDGAFTAFQKAIASLQDIYDFQAEIIACDAHPDYLATQFAHSCGLPVISVQHHYAHILSCMAEHEIEFPVLGVAWDGTGYGEDGTIWGGEFLYLTEENFERIAYFRPFQLPGGERAIKEPRRTALGLLTELGINLEAMAHLASLQAFSHQELAITKTMLSRNLNSPTTSSVGRLFDAVASLLNICQQGTFEGQAAMALEFAIGRIETAAFYPFKLSEKIIDWQLIIQGILADLDRNLPLSEIAAKFHNTLGEIIVALAQQVGEPKIILSGGCFQNRYLTEYAIRRLREEKFYPYWHQRLPPNDGGIALGQVIAALKSATISNII